MSASAPAPYMLPPNFPLLDRGTVLAMLDNELRMEILTHLSDGTGYGVTDLANLIHSSPPNVSKYLQAMRAAGILYIGRGKLYYLQPAYNPNPGSGLLDFGHCVVRLNVQKPA